MNRNQRDEFAARGAVEMASQGGRPAIAVDDYPKTLKMLTRVERVAKKRKLTYTVEHASHGIFIHFDKGGRVYIVAADKLIGTSKESSN